MYWVHPYSLVSAPSVFSGSVLDQALESLLHRLRGLCDNMEPETFSDHELVYLLKGQQGNPFILRARRSLSHPTSPWHLRYLGQPEVGDKSRHALVRNCVDVAASHSLPEFLNEMGFRMDHEFVANGHIFRKGAMKIVVSKLSRILVPGNTENMEHLSLSYLVELSVLAPAGQDTVSEDMRSFAEQLKPLVHLEKIDPSKQRHWWIWWMYHLELDIDKLGNFFFFFLCIFYIHMELNIVQFVAEKVHWSFYFIIPANIPFFQALSKYGHKIFGMDWNTFCLFI